MNGSITFETPSGEPGRFAGQGVRGKRAFATVAAGARVIASPVETGGWFVQSITLDGKDITDRAFDLQSDATTFVITYTDKPSKLSGVVKDTRGSANVDAVVLGRALIGVLRDKAPLSLLDSYASTRRQAATEVLPLTSRLTRVATVRPILLRKVRNILLRLLNRIPGFKARLALQLSGIGRRQLAELPVPVSAEPPAAKGELRHAA